jgi:hypothetical protein
MGKAVGVVSRSSAGGRPSIEHRGAWPRAGDRAVAGEMARTMGTGPTTRWARRCGGTQAPQRNLLAGWAAVAASRSGGSLARLSSHASNERAEMGMISDDQTEQLDEPLRELAVALADALESWADNPPPIMRCFPRWCAQDHAAMRALARGIRTRLQEQA